MLKKILFALLGLAGLLLIGGAVAYWITSPAAPAPGSPAAQWLQPGDYDTDKLELVFYDHSRPTAANNDYPGADLRALVSSAWYPVDTDTPRPLIVYSHGFMSNRNGGAYLAQALASHGYVVVAADYPLTHGSAPGGPLVTDVVHQPGDVSFIIDQVLAGDLAPLVAVDPERIGVAGLSLGGLTSTLSGYHKRWRDPRIKAVVSIAGPAQMFDNTFFATSDAPFLMIAGTLDAIVHYVGNAHDIPERVPGAGLVTIEGGSHVGFADIAEPFLRYADNPDELGCRAILANLESDAAAENPFTVLGTRDDGVVFSEPTPQLCSADGLPESLHPGRQQMITEVALSAFFEAQFAADPDRRTAAHTLLRTIDENFTEARVTFSTP